MLYGADADKLPYSRFKRISVPRLPEIKTLLLVSWAIAAAVLYHHRNEILDFKYSDFSISFLWLGNISLVAFVFFQAVVFISDIYKASFGLSLNKISLTNAEIEIGKCSENSILNRHLDEIIYFFQQTKYDVVVIEDIDRFGDPEIFVKLREINKLINDNKKTSAQVKFLYALKDDMFAHKNRAKFFDFIIPVVPIINSSNSLDKVLVRLKEHDFAKNIDAQFLREVSLYINDLRLIHNIFNEFVIYYERLKSGSLNVTKLLAMMIYKNVYPNDFENLHHGKGALFEICRKRNEFLQKSKDQLNEKINGLRTSLNLSDTEKARSIRELIAIYIGHLVVNSNHAVNGIVLNNQYIQFSEFKTFEQFKPIITERNINLYNNHNYQNNRIPTNKSFSQFEEEINPNETFLSRKENIENNSESKKTEFQQKIRLVEKEISGLPLKQLFQLIQSCDIEIDELIKNCKITDSALLVYLIKNGYLDENYHLYISNFHEGRLTKNDWDYLLTIRNFNHPEPNQKIDTPKEICANMREEDFGHKYVLNVNLIDYLLENKKVSSKHIDSAMGYISQNFEQSEAFFSAYFNAGKYIADFILYLSQKWPGLASAAISSKHEAELISYILRFVDAKYISDNMNTDNQLTDYLSKQGHLVLASNLQLPNDYNVLKRLNVRFHGLLSLEKNNAVIEFAHTECLYAITSDNVNYVLQKFADPQCVDTINLDKANYTSILAAGSENLKDYVEENLPDYFEKVFLILPDNSEENEIAIKTLINHEMIDDGQRKITISKQNHIFETLEGIPVTLWSHMFRTQKVVISWDNISKYLNYKDSDKEVVTELLRCRNVVDSLSCSNISIDDLGKDESLLLSNFVFHNDEINDSDYCKLIDCLPYIYPDFPTEISEEKIKYLAKTRRVKLTEQSFSYVGDDNQLAATLISKNFNEYLKEKDKYPINDDVRELLLSSEISNENKIGICLDVTPSGAIKSEQLSRLIANVLVSNEIDYSKIDDAVLSSAIINAQTTSDSIRLLMKCILTWDEKKTMEVLANLPEPFREISLYGKRPKLDNNELNLEFARLLKAKGFISSVKEEGSLLKIYTFKSSDHSEENN